MTLGESLNLSGLLSTHRQKEDDNRNYFMELWCGLNAITWVKGPSTRVFSACLPPKLAFHIQDGDTTLHLFSKVGSQDLSIKNTVYPVQFGFQINNKYLFSINMSHLIFATHLDQSSNALSRNTVLKIY